MTKRRDVGGPVDENRDLGEGNGMRSVEMERGLKMLQNMKRTERGLVPILHWVVCTHGDIDSEGSDSEHMMPGRSLNATSGHAIDERGRRAADHMGGPHMVGR